MYFIERAEYNCVKDYNMLRQNANAIYKYMYINNYNNTIKVFQ